MSYLVADADSSSQIPGLDPLSDPELSVNDYVRLCTDIDQRYKESSAVASFVEIPTSLPDLSWGIIENDDGRFGYIRLRSFMERGYEAGNTGLNQRPW